MRFARRRLLQAAVLLGPAVAGAPGGLVLAADPPNPFVAVVKNLRIGTVTELRGSILVTLRLPSGDQAGATAHVGLRGAKATVVALPPPAGDFHVRVTNHLDVPLEIPPGDTLLSPIGPSRSSDRTVWVLPRSSAYVPMIHAGVLAPPAPYVSRGLGLTPFEQERVREGLWDERVRDRNRRFGVEAERLDDAAAAYVTPRFEQAFPAYEGVRDQAVLSDLTVGVIVCDNRGPFFARVETDVARFRAAWPSLMAGIALDDLVAIEEGREPWRDAPAVRKEIHEVLRAVETDEPASRVAFGTGREYRWAVRDGTGEWSGLVAGGRPIALTLVRNPPPRGELRPPRPPEDPTPDPGPIDRKARPTPFEERFNERRDDPPGGGGLNPPGGR